MRRKKLTALDWLVKKATTRVNRKLKKRPIPINSVRILLNCLADMMVLDEGVGVEVVTTLIRTGKKRKSAGKKFYTNEEREELLTKLNEDFSDKDVSNEK